MQRALIIYFILITATLHAQRPKGELREFTGTVKTFKSGFGLAYERLIVDIADKEEHFVFNARDGKILVDQFQRGDAITFRAIVNPELNERLKKMSEVVQKSFKRDRIRAVKIDDTWISLSDDSTGYAHGKIYSKINFKTFLDREVKGEYVDNGLQVGLIFDDGLVAYNWFRQNKRIKIGDVVSFKGFKYPQEDGFRFPVPDVNEVYFFGPLVKEEGVIKSLLFKQNHVCIGMSVKTTHGEKRVGIPSDYGSMIKDLAMHEKKITFYYAAYDPSDGLNLPDLQAIVSDGDTLLIRENNFYGGNDIKHDHVEAEVKGKITQVNRSDKGRIISIIVGNDCYVEVDHTMEKQLGNYFRRGEVIEVSGLERIKAEGEVYRKDYRIITPKTVSIDGKRFLLGQLP